MSLQYIYYFHRTGTIILKRSLSQLPMYEHGTETRFIISQCPLQLEHSESIHIAAAILYS